MAAVNLKNGTVDLRKGELREHRREDFITQIIPYDYPTSEATPVRWIKFLREIFDDDTEMIDFMHRLCGSILVGEQTDHIFPIFYGTGANGKSTLTVTLIKALGDYAMTLGEDFLIQTKNKRHSTKLWTSIRSDWRFKQKPRKVRGLMNPGSSSIAVVI